MTDVKGKKVLIVEDDFALADAFKLVLEFAQFKVSNVFNGEEALNFIEKDMPDIIVLDILMPVMDGREFLRSFKNKHHVPIIALSNLDGRSEVEGLRELGASNYVLKSSVSPQTLVELVTKTLAEHAITAA